MIYSKISDLKKYISYSDNMRKAIEFILSTDLKTLPLGKTFIDGESIYINKSIVETKAAELQKYEVHHKYIDIQIDIEGDELLYNIQERHLNCIQDYNEDGDYALYSFCKEDVKITLNENYCAVIFPGEIHMPCIKCNAKSVIKCVVKVLDE